MTAPDLRPSDAPGAAATMETGPSHQLAQLAKVLPAGGPIGAHPALQAMQHLDNDGRPVGECRRCPDCSNPGTCHREGGRQ